MNLRQAEKIMHDFGKFMEITNGQLMFLFGVEIPESLLPYPKKRIKEALNMMAKHFAVLEQKDAVREIEAIGAYLMSYVNDQQAIHSLNRRLSIKAYDLKKYFTIPAKKKQEVQLDYSLKHTDLV